MQEGIVDVDLSGEEEGGHIEKWRKKKEKREGPTEAIHEQINETRPCKKTKQNEKAFSTVLDGVHQRSI